VGVVGSSSRVKGPHLPDEGTAQSGLSVCRGARCTQEANVGGLCPGTGRLSPHDIGSVTRFSGHPVRDRGSGSVLGVFGRRTAGRSGKHGCARLAAEWDGRSRGGWTLAGSRGGRRHPLGLAWRADSPLGATRHANFCTIGQPDGLQVGSRMPFCVLRNDIPKNEVYVNRLVRRPVVAQSNST